MATSAGKQPKSSKRSRSIFALPRIVRRLKNDEQGVTAVEFGLLAAPFFMLLMAIIETSILFFAGQVFESAADDIGRMVRTGQIGQTGDPVELKNALCERTDVLFDCDAINLDLQVVATFADLGSAPEPEDGEIDPDDFTVSAVGAQQIVMMTIMTEWPVFTNYMQKYLSGLKNGNALLTATTVFRTEPFS